MNLKKWFLLNKKKRGIQLGWSYVKGVIKVFEQNYPAAISFAEKGDYLKARNSLIDALMIPVYRNNKQLHRAVALVILRPYLNDVIGKIAMINQYLTAQQYSGEVKSIFDSYQALFPVLELQEWDKALETVTKLNERTKALENQPKQQEVQYPGSFGKLDQEIQQAILNEAAPKPEGAINLKALLVDLDLKEKIIRANTQQELTKIQKQYDQAVKLLEADEWEEARNSLAAIQFPPELAEDAKVKMEQIDKIFAFEDQKSNKNSK